MKILIFLLFTIGLSAQITYVSPTVVVYSPTIPQTFKTYKWVVTNGHTFVWHTNQPVREVPFAPPFHVKVYVTYFRNKQPIMLRVYQDFVP